MFTWHDKHILRTVVKCLSGNEKSCAILDLYVAMGVLEVRVAKELQADPSVFDVDPDGAAALELFFPSKNLSATQLASKLTFAKEFHVALTNIVSQVDKEIREMGQQQARER
jgi:hypothetical protein